VQLPHDVLYNLYAFRRNFEPYIEGVYEECSHVLAWYSYEVGERFEDYLR
jgi:hypothetical protein